MLDGCMYGVERTVFKTEDIFHGCKIELGKEVKFALTNCYKEVKESRSKNVGTWNGGKVVADYETYIVLEHPSGYRYCIDKVDIATKDIVVKGFKPNIHKVYAVDFRL